MLLLLQCMQVLRDVPSTDLGALVARWASVLRGDQDAPCPSSTLGPLPDSAVLRATLFANELQALKGLEAEIEGLRQGGNTPAPAPAVASSSSAARSQTASKGSGKSAFAAAVAAAGRPAKKMSITKRRQLALHVSVPLCCKTIALLAGCDANFVPCLHPTQQGAAQSSWHAKARQLVVNFFDRFIRLRLRNVTEMPLHEIACYKSQTALRRAFSARPRGSLIAALAHPRVYLPCSCCPQDGYRNAALWGLQLALVLQCMCVCGAHMGGCGCYCVQHAVRDHA